MHVLIISAGSWGDIAPHTGVARRLVDAGHTVTLSTHDRLGRQISARGLDFRPLGMDVSDLFGAGAEQGECGQGKQSGTEDHGGHRLQFASLRSG